jgi:N-methylhydantoinase A
LPHAIAFDMGGTTAKAAILLNSNYDVHTIYYVGGYARGFPVRINVVDIVEVGAGGGSIAVVDDQARLHVGPASAGSDPGPVAYARGGTEPTVTDANIVLGRINPQGLLGGELKLDAAAAAKAIDSRLAKPLGYAGSEATKRAAAGVLTIANVTMANALRRVTTERGHDPRKFTMLAYGGSGPLHAADLARELHIPIVIVPLHPSNFSALGMLMANAQQDSVRTFVTTISENALARMAQIFIEMEEELADTLWSNFGAEANSCIRQAELRYKGQMHSVRIPIADSCDVANVREVFNQVYKSRYGHVDTISQVEFVSLRVTLRAEEIRPTLAARGLVLEQPAPATVREVYLAGHGDIPMPVLNRNHLPVGFQSRGPALIQEYGTTTLIGPSDSFEIGKFGEIKIVIGRDLFSKPLSLTDSSLRVTVP